MLKPSDLSILITGGARGIGAAVARLLAADGAKVMITDILQEEGEALAQEFGANVTFRQLDVTSETDWSDAVAEAEGSFGKLNALFNNAGIVTAGGVQDTTPENFRKVIDVDLTSCFLGIHTAVPAMRRAGEGIIVNTSSTAGLKGYTGIAPYVTAKWGLRGLTKAAALDLAPDNIRVLSLHPGPIRTPLTAQAGNELVNNLPLPRYGELDEVARMVRFMLTEASYSTGSEFVTDGGAVTG